MRSSLGIVFGVLLLVGGCGSAGLQEPARARGGDLPTTPQALAAVAAEHAGEPDSASATSRFQRDEFTGRAVATELRYGSDGEYDGDSLSVAVGTGWTKDPTSCASLDSLPGECVRVGDGLLAWEELEPEEDPGLVLLAVPKGDAVVVITYAGPDITGDPRRLDLPIGVDDLQAIAADPRVDLTTSRAALDAGRALASWQD
jgi:hypothetical protein